MNEIVPSPVPHGTTQAADGFPRFKWTLAEFERLSSPSAEGYASVSTVPPSETVTPHLLSALAVSLGGLGIA